MLLDVLAVGHDARQFGRQVDQHRVAPAAEHRGGRALDGGQGHAQLVADHAEELGAHALQLLKRGEVLHGDHHRRDGAVLGVDRRCVDQRGDAAPVGGNEHDRLGAHRLGAAQHTRERELAERDLAPGGTRQG